MPALKPKTAIFIMPATSKAWVGAEGLWVTVAGLAAAAERKLGASVVVTQDRITSAGEALDYPIIIENEKKRNYRQYVGIPHIFRIIVKDLLEWKNSRNWEIFDELNQHKEEVAFVWEKHDLFSGRGLKLALEFGVPYISYVHAPVIWEAEKWGVKRYLWGAFLERREAAVLKKADAVAVVSREVKTKLMRMGVIEEKIFVSPMAVDPDLYKISEFETEQLKRNLGIEGKYVIGWTGSFRGFHGLNQILKGFGEVVKEYQNSILLLVGDGKERCIIEELVKTMGLKGKVIFTGKKPYRILPLYLSVLDLAVAGATTSMDFHYSPQKIRDYMAAGKPVLAPKAGEVPYLFEDGVHLKLFEVGDAKSFSQGIRFFLENRKESAEIASAGKKLILKKGTWDHELEKSLEFLRSKR